jgi:hypothetical protein
LRHVIENHGKQGAVVAARMTASPGRETHNGETGEDSDDVEPTLFKYIGHDKQPARSSSLIAL